MVGWKFRLTWCWSPGISPPQPRIYTVSIYIFHHISNESSCQEPLTLNIFPTINQLTKNIPPVRQIHTSSYQLSFVYRRALRCCFDGRLIGRAIHTFYGRKMWHSTPFIGLWWAIPVGTGMFARFCELMSNFTSEDGSWSWWVVDAVWDAAWKVVGEFFA